MGISRILTFHNSNHVRHAPTIEVLHGHLVPFFEMPQRVENLVSGLTAAGLIDLCEPAVEITKADICKTHDPRMVDFLELTSRNVCEIVRRDLGMYHLEHLATGDDYYYESMFPARFLSGKIEQHAYFISDSTSPIGAGTWDAMLHAANAAYVGAKTILGGEKCVYALCRPPGHHAGIKFVGGYCYLNNAAIAANVLRQIGKVAILDVDYHHGHGTQDIFWDDPDVFYVSLHADPAVDYPYYVGNSDEVGGENARGSNLNLPLPHGTDEVGYLDTLHTAIARIHDFAPAVLVVSLGFDTFKDDAMGRFKLEIESYRKVGSAVHAMGYPTLYVQEGGYCVERLGDIAVSFFRGVLEE